MPEYRLPTIQGLAKDYQFDTLPSSLKIMIIFSIIESAAYG
jgi:hypothetical protein